MAGFPKCVPMLSPVSRSDMAAYREEMKKKMSEYKMNTIRLVTQLYNTKDELTRVSIETQDRGEMR